MKKIIKTNHAKLIEKELKRFENYLHYAGIPDAMIFEFSSNENEAEVVALLTSLSDDHFEKKLKKEKKISDLYDEMVESVYSDMEADLGSRSDVSVTADVQTWQLMMLSPGDFITAELATESAVKSFAQSKLGKAIAYVKKRDLHLKAFQKKKKEIV